MGKQTLFNGNFVVFDAMVIINFHGLLILNNIFHWSKGEIIVEKKVKKEAKYSQSGAINLNTYLTNNIIIEEEISGNEQEEMFLDYLEDGKFHEGESACLTLAITKGYGLATDEKIVRDEFKRICPGKICLSSWGIIDRAEKMGYLSSKEAGDYKQGLFYI